MHYQEKEDKNGLRLSFHLWPNNRIDANAIAIPIGAVYTPLKQSEHIHKVEYEAQFCRACFCVMSCYSKIDFQLFVWTCPICNARNPLPSTYHQITQDFLPFELMTESTTMDYLVPENTAPPPPVFLLVVDTAALSKPENFSSLKSVLIQSLSSFPSNSLVGLISFGRLVHVHELVEGVFARSYIFSGNKTYRAHELSKFLGVSQSTSSPFFLPFEDVEITLTTIIDKLTMDTTLLGSNERPERCTGAAIHIAVTLIEAIFPTTGGQIFLFTSGPITKGPGAMASATRTELLRQHVNIQKDTAPLTKGSTAFFQELAQTASQKHVTVNYISAAFEEKGIFEMQSLMLQSGGWVLNTETWSDTSIISTIQKYFEKIFPVQGTNCQLTLNISQLFKIQGCIGPCISGQCLKPILASEKVVGHGGTNVWEICSLLPTTTLAFYFDIPASKSEPIPSNSSALIQFVSRYRHLQSGRSRFRVTTTAIAFGDLQSQLDSFSKSFDQLAAVALLGKLSMWKARHEEPDDVIHFLDRTLIRFCRKFATYTKGDPLTFNLPETIRYLPQFLYHFRRSPFLNIFNATPDLSTTDRHALFLEDTTNLLFMIQPTLLQYTLDNSESTVVLLDMQSLQKNCVLVLDTFFTVVVWYGSDIASWRNQGYHEKPEYENIKNLINAPKEEAEALMVDRFPTPFLVVCDQDTSLSRFLLSRCSPVSYPEAGSTIRPADTLGSDEPSYQKFLAKLKEASVNE